jgi:hypothetical protein
MKLQCEFLQIHVLSISLPLNLYCLMLLHNNFSTPHFKSFKQCISYIIFLWCEIPTVPEGYIIREKICLSMHNFTVEIRNGSYMFQQQSSHKDVYTRSIKANHIPVFYIQLQMRSGRYFGIT